MIKCIIFDCDGTLVDSEVLCNQALSLKLKQRSIDLSTEQLVHRFRGFQLTSILQTLEVEYDVVLDSTFISSYRKLVAHFFEQDLVPCTGVDQTLSQIDLAMCVASNGPLAKMQRALKVANLAHYFGDNTFSAYEIDSWKPDPGLFLHAAQKMGFEASECLVVEDSLVGVEAAQSSGMNVILYDPRGEYCDAKQIPTIDAFGKLLEHLK